MTTSLSDVLKPTSVEQAEATVLGVLEGAGFPATSWQPKSFPRTMVKALATVGASIANTVSNVAAGGFSTLAASLGLSGWLDLKAEQDYGNTRAPAIATVGQMVLTNATGSGQTISVGMWIADGEGDNAHRFEVTGGGSLAAPNGSTLPVAVRAEKPGADYNIPIGAPLFIAGGVLPGVTVSNPPIGSTGTWVTTAGADQEGDAALAERNTTMWATLAPAGSRDSFKAWARAAVPTATRVEVDDAAPFGPGTVAVIMANAAGGASPSEVATADAYLQTKRSLPSRVRAQAATNVDIAIQATVYIEAVHADTAFLQAQANLVELQAEHGISGRVYRSEIITALSSPLGVRNVTLIAPADDATLGSDGVPVFAISLTKVVLS